MDYITEPTAIRVFFEEDHWAIDGIDDVDGYTEAIWTGYDEGHGFTEYATAAQALLRVPEFAADWGWGHLPVILFDEAGSPHPHAERADA